MPIRIVLADDHPVVRRGLIQFFSEEHDLEVIAECDDGSEALAAITRTKPDVAIIDLRMPVFDGLEVLRRLKETQQNAPVILLAGNISDEEVVQAMRLGVKGIVLKEMAPTLLVQCVKKVASGGVWIEKDAVSRAMQRILEHEENRDSVSKVLTRRELEIVRMVAGGLGNRQIGEKLFISEGTVKSHLHTIFEKLDLKSRAQLMVYARAHGIE